MKCSVEGSCKYVHTANVTYVLKEGYDSLRGGTPFVPYRGHYHIALLHCRYRIQNTKHYTAHLVLLDTTLFRVVYLSGHIPLHPRIYKGHPPPVTLIAPFYYPTGLLVEGMDSLLVFAHINDHTSCLFRLRGVHQVLDGAIQLHTQTGRKVPLTPGCIQELMYATMHRHVSLLTPYHYPLNTWRNNNVAITSKRHHFDVIKMTSFWRNNDVIIA